MLTLTKDTAHLSGCMEHNGCSPQACLHWGKTATLTCLSCVPPTLKWRGKNPKKPKQPPLFPASCQCDTHPEMPQHIQVIVLTAGNFLHRKRSIAYIAEDKEGSLLSRTWPCSCSCQLGSPAALVSLREDGKEMPSIPTAGRPSATFTSTACSLWLPLWHSTARLLLADIDG